MGLRDDEISFLQAVRGVRTLFLDLDNTLLASRKGPLHAAFLREAFRFLGESRNAGFFRSLRALRAMRIALERGDGKFRNDERAGRALAATFGLSETEGHQLAGALAEHVFSRLESQFRPIPGAVEFVDEMKARFSLVLATNPVWPLSVVTLRLSWAGLEPSVFDLITHAQNMHACKPRRAYYRELLSRVDRAPDQVLMIGDSRKKDLPAARVGVPTYLLGSGALRRLDDKAWQGSFSDLQKMLRELHG